MDQRNFDSNQSSITGVPPCYNQQSAFLRQPIFPAFMPGQQFQNVYNPHQAPRSHVYQHQLQYVPPQPIGPPGGFVIVSNMPPAYVPMVKQDQAPQQQYMALAQQSNLTHSPEHVPQLMPPGGISNIPPSPTSTPWSAALTPPSPYRFPAPSISSLQPVSIATPTVIPSRLKLLAEHYAVSQHEKSITSSESLQTTSFTAAPTGSVKSIISPSSGANCSLFSSANGGIDTKNSKDGNGITDIQNLVDYYVNKHVSLSHPKVVCIGEKECLSKGNVKNDNNISESDSIDKVSLEVGKNNDVLNWLSQSESELGKGNPDNSVDKRRVEGETTDEVTLVTGLKEKNDCLNTCDLNDLDEFKLTEITSVCKYAATGEFKAGKIVNSYVEGGSDIVIEEHELLSHNFRDDLSEDSPDNNENITIDLTNGCNESELPIKTEKDDEDDFEKFFFKVTASKHGISISSPEKKATIGKVQEVAQSGRSENTFFNFQKTVNDISSIEGSQSDVGDAFKLKASQSGILVQDPRERIEISTDSDSELNQMFRQDKSKKDCADLERKRHTSTPDPWNTTLDPKIPEFKPRSRKRAMSCELRADAAEFKPESLNSSLSLNTSISGSDLVPVFEKPDPLKDNDHIPSELNEEKQQQISQIEGTTVLKEVIQNTNVIIQASPSTINVAIQTDTELHSETDFDKESSVVFSSIATNTDLLEKKSVGTQHFEEKKVKTEMNDMATMTESELDLDERCEESCEDLAYAKQIMKKQTTLMEDIGKIQKEMKGAEVIEETFQMKENLLKFVVEVMEVFIEGAEPDKFKTVIESKLQVLVDESVAQVKSVSMDTVSSQDSSRREECHANLSSQSPGTCETELASDKAISPDKTCVISVSKNDLGSHKNVSVSMDTVSSQDSGQREECHLDFSSHLPGTSETELPSDKAINPDIKCLSCVSKNDLCSQKNVKKRPKTRGFMEVEDSTDDSDDDYVDASTTVVVDKLDDDNVNTENIGGITTDDDAKQRLKEDESRDNTSESLNKGNDGENFADKPVNCLELECPAVSKIEPKASNEMQMEEVSDAESNKLDSPREKTLFDRKLEEFLENSVKELEDSYCDVNHETTIDELSDEDINAKIVTESNSIPDEDSAMIKMISEKMSAAYGPKPDHKGDSCHILDNSNDEREKTMNNNNDSKFAPPVYAEVTEPDVDLHHNEVCTSSTSGRGPDGLKNEDIVRKETSDLSVGMQNDQIVNFNPPMVVGMPVMQPYVDPSIYQAVEAQLKVLYPEIAGNQAILAQVAMQQTCILQMCLNSQTSDMYQPCGDVNHVVVGVNQVGRDVNQNTSDPNQWGKGINQVGGDGFKHDSCVDQVGTDLNQVNRGVIQEGRNMSEARHTAEMPHISGNTITPGFPHGHIATGMAMYHGVKSFPTTIPIEPAQHTQTININDKQNATVSAPLLPCELDNANRNNYSHEQVEDFQKGKKRRRPPGFTSSSDLSIKDVVEPPNEKQKIDSYRVDTIENVNNKSVREPYDFSNAQKPRCSPESFVHNLEINVGDAAVTSCSSQVVKFEGRTPVTKVNMKGDDSERFNKTYSELVFPTGDNRDTAFQKQVNVDQNTLVNTTLPKTGQCLVSANQPRRLPGKHTLNGQWQLPSPSSDSRGSQPKISSDSQGRQLKISSDSQGRQPKISSDSQGRQPKISSDSRGKQPKILSDSQGKQLFPSSDKQGMQPVPPSERQRSQSSNRKGKQPISQSDKQNKPPIPSSNKQGRQITSTFLYEPQSYPSLSKENWNDEADDYAQTFTLYHDVHKPIVTRESKKAEFMNLLSAPTRKASSVMSSTSVTELCDITLNDVTNTTHKDVSNIIAEKKESVNEWQEVQTKRRRHSSKDQQKDPGKFSTTSINPSTSTVMGKGNQQKRSNFERLVGRMQEEFQHASRQDIIIAIEKIRGEQGSLRGLSMEVIIEKAKRFIRQRKEECQGPTFQKEKEVYTLPPRMQQQALKQKSTTKPVNLLELKLPPKKSASIGFLKMEIPPRMKYSNDLDSCMNTFEEDMCVICHDPLSSESVKELDCQHVFHSHCIAQWVERERTCPTCRQHALFPEEFPRLGK